MVKLTRNMMRINAAYAADDVVPRTYYKDAVAHAQLANVAYEKVVDECLAKDEALRACNRLILADQPLIGKEMTDSALAAIERRSNND